MNQKGAATLVFEPTVLLARDLRGTELEPGAGEEKIDSSETVRKS